MIQGPSQDFSDIEMSAASTEYLNQVINDYASRSLRTIGLAYRHFDQWPPSAARIAEDSTTEVLSEGIFEDLTFFGITDIRDPLRNGARDTV